MKTIMVMFDSLNRHMLPPYGCDWVHAPNFCRLAERTVTFDNCYVGSMPCMPARRELHTGRLNFLHRSWGPLEPFDDSMPEILKKNGVYTHLVTDHGHYWEDGGGNYHTRYNSWEISRGQEGDPWKGEVGEWSEENIGKGHAGVLWRQDRINRKHIREEKDFPLAKTFEAGLEFIRTNCRSDQWFLQIEAFDPHEPFFSPQKYRDMYPHEYNGPHFDWPDYARVKEPAEQVNHCRYEYAALLSMCDTYLGKVLDMMDEYDLWDDTMLIVNTDHGYMLGEHDWWAKCTQPFYNEIAHIPLFIWDPKCGRKSERCGCLVQTIDLAPTILEYFNIGIPADMQGKPLRKTISHGLPVRHAALFGIHGGHVNCTDGRYVYMRSSVSEENSPLYEYTLMPAHMRSRFHEDELQDIELVKSFGFTKGCSLMKISSRGWNGFKPSAFGTLLFDLASDAKQEKPIQDEAIEKMMMNHIVKLMQENEAPAEQYKRMGLSY